MKKNINNTNPEFGMVEGSCNRAKGDPSGTVQGLPSIEQHVVSPTSPTLGSSQGPFRLHA